MVKRRRRKNRLLTDALREVWHTRSRFLSILVLSALAVAFLSGLRTTAPDMEYTADNYYDETNLMDGYALSTLGLVEEDLEALAAAPGIEAVEGGYNVDAVAEDSIVVVRSVPEKLNLLTVEAGRLPERADECVTEELLLIDLGLSIGDTLSLVPGEDSEDALERQDFTIVGTVKSPLYVSTDRGTSSLGTGSVSAYVYIPAENFTWDYYTVAYFTGAGLRELNSYSDAYDDGAEALLDSLEGLAEERAQLRQDSLVGEAQAEIDDARAELEDAKAEAEQELADAEQELADARQELDDGWAEYYDGLQEFEDGRAEGEQELADGQKELDDALVELNDGEQELADARKELDEGWDEYYDGYWEYQDGLEEFEEGYQEYLDGLEQFEDGEAEYEAGVRQLSRALVQLNDGEAEYAAGKAQFDQFVQAYLLPAAAESGLSYTTVDALCAALAAEGSDPNGPLHLMVDAALGELMQELQGTLALLDTTNTNIQEWTREITEKEARLKEIGAGIQAIEAVPEDQRTEEQNAELAALRQEQTELNAALDGSDDSAGLRNQLIEATVTAQMLQAGLEQSFGSVEAAKAFLDQWQAPDSQLPKNGEGVRTTYLTLLETRRELDDAYREHNDGSAEMRTANVRNQDSLGQQEEG